MHAILRGSDHTELDRTAAVTVAPDLAIALSRGRHLKSYTYTDPNEDVVAVSRRGAATALVVADGHGGHQASHTAVDVLMAQLQEEIPAWDRRTAVLAFHDVNTRIREVRSQLAGPHRGTRTTLVAAVVDVDEHGQPYLTHAGVGDSAVIVVRAGASYQLTRDRHHFLGDRLSAPMVAGAMDFEQTDLEDGDVVVVVSDGFTNFARPDDLADVAGEPEEIARAVIDRAGECGAGDNVAVAVLVLGAPATVDQPATADQRATPDQPGPAVG